ncbi:HicB family protein [Clostridia bacterium]|nr:HicB family protein [Clostridia bacterium]
MKYVYPAILIPVGNGYSVEVPDLPGCCTCGKSLADALKMAEDATSMWLWDAENKKEIIPSASRTLNADAPQFVNFIVADTDAYRKEHDSRAVKKTVSIPNWLNTQAEKANAPFSQILQEGLKQYLRLEATH